MVRSITKHNLPDNYKDRTDLIHQTKSYFDLNTINQLTKNKPLTTDEWTTFLFQKNGWQLTVHGSVLFRTTFQSYKIENFNYNQLTGKVIINLNRLLQSPWCYAYQCLYVWNQSRWFEMQLFDGDLKRFVDFHTPSE